MLCCPPVNKAGHGVCSQGDLLGIVSFYFTANTFGSFHKNTNPNGIILGAPELRTLLQLPLPHDLTT